MSSLITYTFSEKTKACSLWMLLGNMRIVSEKTDIPYETLSDWKNTEWWSALVDEIRASKKAKRSNSLDVAVETSLEVIQDRLENGDFILNNKTGEIQRKPVSLRDVSTITNNLLSRQLQMEELQEKVQNKESTVKETLEMLAKEFQKFNRIQSRNKAEVVEFKEVT